MAKHDRKKKKGKSKGKGKGSKKRATARSVDWESVEQKNRAAAYARLMILEERLYQLWEERSGGQMNWAGEALGVPVEDETMTLWLAAVGDKVAALDTMEERPSRCRRGRHSPRRLRGKSSR